MTDIAAWLDDAITAREQLAQAVEQPADWHQGSDDDEWESLALVCMWPPEFHTPYEQDKHWRGLTAHDEQLAAHIAANDPASVLRRCAADRKLIADLQAERHHVNDGDCWYTCSAATEERDGDKTCDDKRFGDPCDCGRDERVQRRLQLLAEGYGWMAR